MISGAIGLDRMVVLKAFCVRKNSRVFNHASFCSVCAKNCEKNSRDISQKRWPLTTPNRPPAPPMGCPARPPFWKSTFHVSAPPSLTDELDDVHLGANANKYVEQAGGIFEPHH